MITRRDKLIEVGRPRFERGYWQGMRQAAVLVPLQITRLQVSADAVRQFDCITATACPLQAAELSGHINPAVDNHPVLGRLLRMALAVLIRMGMPVMGGGAGIKPDAKNPQLWIIGLPAIAEGIRAPQATFALACWLLNELAAGHRVQEDAVVAEIRKLSNQFRSLAPAGVNTLRFLQAAHEMGIPWRHVANNVYQFGWGARSRWLDSSFTDETSTISAALARDKVACAKVLRDAGLPVPKHRLVSTAEQAVQVADLLGYPVVVKPANLDGGIGVLAGVRDANAVIQAFTAAAKLSKRVLVEEFIDGNDYRIRVCKGEVIGVVIRSAAAVVGDGARSVRSLIDGVNLDRAKQMVPFDLDIEHGSKPILADDEIQRWLEAQGLNLDSVIPAGQRVRLRGAANLNLGGTTWDVTREAHPENLDLAIQAAAALRLDIAGVDVLLPDIARCWKETGGAVCEVNGQPQFSNAAAHCRVLERIVRAQGRIPVVGVMHPDLDTSALAGAAEDLKLHGLRVYFATTARQCEQALKLADAQAVIWQMDVLPSPTDGVPVDRLTLMIQPRCKASTQAAINKISDAHWELSEDPDSQLIAQRVFNYLCEAC